MRVYPATLRPHNLPRKEMIHVTSGPQRSRGHVEGPGSDPAHWSLSPAFWRSAQPGELQLARGPTRNRRSSFHATATFPSEILQPKTVSALGHTVVLTNNGEKPSQAHVPGCRARRQRAGPSSAGQRLTGGSHLLANVGVHVRVRHAPLF